MEQLKHSQIAPVRAKKLAEQKGLCVLCERKPQVPCLDHCHTGGHLRGVLCRGCNALLGKLENNRGRYGLADQGAFSKFCNNVAQYLTRHQFGTTLHPTFKSPEQKRLARNAKARATRAKEKV